MKSFVAFACILTSLAAGSLVAQDTGDHAGKMANIRKLIDITGGTKMVDQMFSMMAANFKTPEQQKVFQSLRSEMNFNQIYEIIIPSYDKYLTADEVKELVRFYESPLGRKLIDSQPKIMSDSMPRIMQWAQEVQARVTQKMKEQGVQ